MYFAFIQTGINQCPCRVIVSGLFCKPYSLRDLPEDLMWKCEQYFELVGYKTYDVTELTFKKQNLSTIDNMSKVFPNLISLKLIEVEVKDLNAGAFSGMHSLSHLNILSSRLEQIKDGTLDEATALRSFDFTDTKLAIPR